MEAEAKVLIIQALLALMLDSSKDGLHPGSFFGSNNNRATLHVMRCLIVLWKERHGFGRRQRSLLSGEVPAISSCALLSQ